MAAPSALPVLQIPPVLPRDAQLHVLPAVLRGTVVLHVDSRECEVQVLQIQRKAAGTGLLSDRVSQAVGVIDAVEAATKMCHLRGSQPMQTLPGDACTDRYLSLLHVHACRTPIHVMTPV